jgi:hypothetical protein
MRDIFGDLLAIRIYQSCNKILFLTSERIKHRLARKRNLATDRKVVKDLFYTYIS